MAAPTTTAATTIVIPKGSTIFIQTAFPTTTLIPPAPPFFPASVDFTADHSIITSGAKLYLPYTPEPSSNITCRDLIASLNGAPILSSTPTTSSALLFYGLSAGNLVTPFFEEPTTGGTVFSQGTVLFVPVNKALVPESATPTNVVSVQTLFDSLTSISTTLSSSGQTTAESSTVDGTATLQPPAIQTSSSSASSPSSSGNHVKPQPTVGEAVGGAVGGIIVGLLLGIFIAWCCLGLRRARKNKDLSGFESPKSPTAYPLVPTRRERQRTVVETSDLSGWRKHLPSERGVDGISHAFKAVFHHVDIHVHGYYGNIAAPASSNDLAALVGLLTASKAEATIVQAHESVQMLEGILNRWIVSRISLRCEIDQSLLPGEFTGIPKHAHWDMETHEERLVLGVESRKGFPQALSQWRVLTGFLYGDPADQQDFKSVRDANIEQAVKLFAKAYSPWKLPGKSHADRDSSLRSILVEASAAGSQLFTQPTTFAFEWQSHGKDTVISPALVMRTDENGEPIRRSNTLIEARCARTRS
ncbi:hypothetical protein LTR86_001754 [Recurvomyces mirabilis]|nr:hypothetical protein LTR86_001754 [Recurvomyces mirabilis]